MGLWGLGGLKSAFSIAQLIGQNIVARTIRLTAAAASNAITIATAGARLKFSDGGTTDYLSSDGATQINAAGDLGVAGVLRFTNAASGIIRGAAGGAQTIRIDDTVGFQAIYGTSSIQASDPNTTITNTGGTTIITGDTTSPAKAAFRITPQDAAPTGANVVGDMYVSTAGVLYICTVAGTPGTWTVVGTQT